MKIKLFAILLAMSLMVWAQENPATPNAAPETKSCCHHANADAKDAAACCGKDKCDMKDGKSCCADMKSCAGGKDMKECMKQSKKDGGKCCGEAGKTSANSCCGNQCERKVVAGS
jgi:hypothetical protein